MCELQSCNCILCTLSKENVDFRRFRDNFNEQVAITYTNK